ncbi:YbaN family protein [Ureibacillus massiliensis]|nr:YbaN family protein [Ureibacillus massiliensis]
MKIHKKVMAIKLLKSVLLMIFGFITLALGVLGIIIPVLPGLPFLLIAGFCFTKSSKRLDRWFKRTPFYKKYVRAFLSKRGMTRKEKIRINLIADFFIILSVIYVDILLVKFLLIIMAFYKHYYFIYKIKTLKPLRQ